MNTYSSVRVGVAGATGMPGWSCCACSPGIRTRDVRPRWRRARGIQRLPALARIWDAPVEPPRRRCASPTRDRRGVPGAAGHAAAEVAPSSLDRGTRVFDLSGAFRLRDAALRAALVSATPVAPRPARLRLDRAAPAELPRARAGRVPGLLSDRGDARAAAARRRPACSSRASSSTRSPASPAPARRRPSGRISRECHGSISAYGVFAHRHAAEIEQELGDAGDVRAAPGAARPRHPRDDLCAAARRASTRRPSRRRSHAAYAELAVRAADAAASCRRSSTSRTRTSATSAGASIAPGGQLVMVVVHRQPREGGGRPGDAELQRGVRLRRKARACSELPTITVLKLGGELLEDAAAMQRAAAAAIVRWPQPARSSSSTAAAARSTPSCARAAWRRGSSTACASPTRHARRRRRRAGGADEHGARRGARRGRRARGRADRR